MAAFLIRRDFALEVAAVGGWGVVKEVVGQGALSASVALNGQEAAGYCPALAENNRPVEIETEAKLNDVVPGSRDKNEQYS